MFLYIFWLVPAIIFLFFFTNDRRRLVNAYLFSISLGLSSWFLHLYCRTDRALVLTSNLLSLFFPYLLSLFYSVFFSQPFFFFLMVVKWWLLKVKDWPISSPSYMGSLLSEPWQLHFLPYFPGKHIFMHLADFALFYSTFLYLSYCFIWDLLILLPYP